MVYEKQDTILRCQKSVEPDFRECLHEIFLRYEVELIGPHGYEPRKTTLKLHAHCYTCAIPPSAKSSMPVTKLESSDARNRATLATSSACPMRPSGTCEASML